MNVLITGSAGFVGFHIARRLLVDGHTVVGFDGMTPYYDPQLKEARHKVLSRSGRFTPVIGRLEDPDALQRAAAAAAPDLIIHLAAQAGVRYSLEQPKLYLDANVIGSWNVLELARQAKPRHLLLASTSSVYGSTGAIPFREDQRADEPLTLYAASKRAMEAMAHAYAHLHHIPATVVRFFTVYGPWGRPDMALFKFVDAILAGRPIEVYGEGRMQRDFTYIDDLVEAIVRLLDVVPPQPEAGAAPVSDGDTLSPVAPFRIVNIGGGRPVGLLDFVAMVEKHTGKRADRRLLSMQPGDAPVTVASADLLQALTGYRPATPLDDGVKAFVEWYREYYSR